MIGVRNMKYILDGKKMVSREETHKYLKETFGFSEYYGENLDALHDCLTDLCEETKLTFLHFPSLPFPSAGLLNVLRDSEEENEKLEISLVTN